VQELANALPQLPDLGEAAGCRLDTRDPTSLGRDPGVELLGARGRGPGEAPRLAHINLVRFDDGTYLDVPRWESREAADAAVEKFAEVPEADEITASSQRT
jgi:hypothetical protein